MAHVGYFGNEMDLSIGFGCSSLDAWSFSELNASVDVTTPPYDVLLPIPQESSLPSASEVNSWFQIESLLNLSNSEINNDKSRDSAQQTDLGSSCVIVKTEENDTSIINETTQMLLCTEQLPPDAEMDAQKIKSEPVKIKKEATNIKPEPIWHGHSNSNSMFAEMFKDPSFAVKGESNPALKFEMDHCAASTTFSLIEALKNSDPSLCDKWASCNQQANLLPPKSEMSFPVFDAKCAYSNEESSVDCKKGIVKEEKVSRKDFRNTVGREFYLDLMSGALCYDELIRLYQHKYPHYAKKFTRNFCTKLRTGRIMNEVTQLAKRKVKDGDEKMRRIHVKSPKGKYQKMTEELIVNYENQHKGIKQDPDLESLFNVNRTTLTRWKKNKLEATV